MREITLTQGKVAWVDDALFDQLNQFKWHAVGQYRTFYARRTQRKDGFQATIHMHGEVFRLLGIEGQPDHHDRNGLNNQASNLRPATPAEQGRNRQKQSNNTSGYIGVTWRERDWKWQARHGKPGKHIGMFETAIEAALAYDEFVYRLDPAFAVLNFPEVYQNMVQSSVG